MLLGLRSTIPRSVHWITVHLSGKLFKLLRVSCKGQVFSTTRETILIVAFLWYPKRSGIPLSSSFPSLPPSPLSLSRGGRTKEAIDAIERRLSYKRRDTGDKAGQRLHLTKLSRGKLTDWSNLKSGITEVQDIYSSTHLWDILSTQGHERVTNESWPCILASHWNPIEEIDHTTKKLYPA